MTDEEIRGRLQVERETLERTVQAVRSGGSLDEGTGDAVEELSVVDQHPADTGTETFDAERDQSLLLQVRRELDDVDAALRRLDKGTYGLCEACGEPVGEERLQAMPAARYCIGHQQLAEGSAAQAGSLSAGQD